MSTAASGSSPYSPVRHDSALGGALVISLDFELAWGVRERVQRGSYDVDILGVREVVPRLLDLFTALDIAATWATVGFLFARSRDELEAYAPRLRPTYADPALNPYGDRIGRDERDDPFHYAPSLIDAIQATPRQEIGTHTYSHYYCTEQGQTAEQFEADLAAAIGIARARNIAIRSVVFPRNQHNPAYDVILARHGITAYRGNPRAWMWKFGNAAESASAGKRLARLADDYVDLSRGATTPWSAVLQPGGVSDVRATCFVRSVRPSVGSLEALRFRRLREGLRTAAQRGGLFHIWWHPHNWGRHVDANLDFLRRLLLEFERCREEYGMRSLSMQEVDRLARTAVPSVTPAGTPCLAIP